VGRLRPELWRQDKWLLHHDNAPSQTSFFSIELFIANDVTAFSHPTYFSLFSQLNTKLKDCHSYTTEVLYDAFKNGENARNGAYALNRLRGWWWPSGPKLGFD
jgi:hypothetical protein